MSEVDFTNSQNINNAIVDVSNYWNSVNNLQMGQGLLPSSRLRDYFASVLPFIQKGEIPIISTINENSINEMFNNVVIDNLPIIDAGGASNGKNYFQPNIYGNTGYSLQFDNDGVAQQFQLIGENGPLLANSQNGQFGGTTNNAFFSLETQQTPGAVSYQPNLNSTGLGNFNITDLRNALVKQHQNELDARAGTRYYEKLLSYWGINVNPLEINRTEFIGGWSGNININNVVQSAPQTSSANTPLGTLGALSITTGQLPKTINYSSSQYGYIIGMVTVRTNITYSQGLPKYFTRINN